MSNNSGIRHKAGTLVAAALMMSLTAGCQSGAINGSAQDVSDNAVAADESPGTSVAAAEAPAETGDETASAEKEPGPHKPAGKPPAAAKKKYKWNPFDLPDGDESVQPILGVFSRLRAGDCDATEKYIAENQNMSHDLDRLLAYGVALCRGENPDRQEFDVAAVEDGWDAQIDGSFGCAAYRSIAGPIRQVPKSAVACTGKAPPEETAGPSAEPGPEATAEPTGEPATDGGGGPTAAPA